MADRNMNFPQGSGFNMMQSTPQFVQPGAPVMPQQRMMMSYGQGQMMSQGQGQMMPQGQIMPQGQGQMMYQNQPRGQMMVSGMFPQQNMMAMRMASPRAPPPTYNQSHAENYQQRIKNISASGQGTMPSGKTGEQIMKERKFQEQQARLKQFGKPSGSGLDPNKLIDSMFTGQGPPKPRTIKKVSPQTNTADVDDGFGDFLSSTQASDTIPQPVVSNGISSTNQSAMQGTTQSTQNASAMPAGQGTSQPDLKAQATSMPQAPPKDLTKMMFESCDLTAPQKAKLFHKPALKEIDTSNKASGLVTHFDSTSARKWARSDELSDLFIQEAVKDEQTLPKVVPTVKKHVSPTSKHPPKPPPWLTDEKLLPALYRQVLEAVLVMLVHITRHEYAKHLFSLQRWGQNEQDDKISTERLYPILMMSGLPKETMGHLWGLCNKISPGQLKTVELYQLLGLIGLIQNNYQVETTDILSRCPYPPVPFLGQPTPQTTPPIAQSPPLPGQTPPLPGQTPPLIGQTPPLSSQTSPLPGQSPPLSGQTPPLPGQTPPLPGQTPPLAAPSPPLATFIVPPTIPAQPFIPANPIPTTVNKESVPIFQETHFPSSAPAHPLGPTHNPPVSSPATLPVTQLPPAVLPQGMLGNIVHAVHEDDDFADFQAAPAPVTATQTTNQQSSQNIPSQSRYISSVPIPDDKAIAATLSPDDLKNSTVDNFFGSDDSSEATSPDDDYFDGYKSADSKPSDSTSQFSTDQSEGEDFRNFENYLDEFQRKKEQLDKDSPLHRPIPRFSKKDSPTRSPSKIFPKAATVTQIQRIPLPTQANKAPQQTHVSSDEFSDFADFQSATVESKAELKPDTLKATASASDLIGDEDKYAALRVLDFSSTPTEDDPGQQEDAKPVTNQEDNWADFQTASSDLDQNATAEPSGLNSETVKDNKQSVLGLYDQNKESDWPAFDEPNKADNSDMTWMIDSAGTNEQNSSLPSLGQAGTNTDDWADFQSTAETDFTGFQSSSGQDSPSIDQATIPSENVSSNSIVNVKKESLGTNEILGLFKVKDEPKINIKSKDDDFGSFETSSISVSESMNKAHGIPSRESSPQVNKVEKRPKLLSEDDDFMKPPPLDMTMEDEDTDDFGGYSRGYDLDDMMQPSSEEKKKVYGGIYGVNQNFVVTGHKKNSKNRSDNKNVTIEITKDSDIDNDSDSASSKDNDTFAGKFGLGKELGEDSQSVSSLDFVVNKRVQTLKDSEGGDNQSVSSGDFGNFETSYNSASMHESKSVDSLELRSMEVPVDSGGSQENSDKDSKDNTPDRDLQEDGFGAFDSGSVPGLPIVGDRYSSLMQDVPGSDKHAVEWQSCLDNACRMIQDANNIFNSISSSSVCNEVIKSAQGSQYIEGVIEIYKVICRITVSATKAGIHSDKLSQLLKDIDLAWNNLTAFLVGGSVMPDSQSLDFNHGVLLSDDTTAQYRACGVCLLDVSMKARGTDTTKTDNAVLVYGGRQYHSPCANFWINCVGSTLPALKLLELL